MSAETARRALALLDLTSLNDGDTEAAIDALCKRAVTPFGAVAAVCIWSRFVAHAKRLLRATPVKIATVVDFPGGDGDASGLAREIAAALGAGADEIDMVFPYRRFLAGEAGIGRAQVAAARAACGGGVTLKVILESGAFADQEVLLRAAREAVAGGADFLKTSTGKIPAGASPQAAQTLLRAIGEAARPADKPVGLKISGGVRTVAQAREYLALADAAMGPRWATPATFRFGASGLLDDILKALGASGAGPKSTSTY
jgi:deoxyribose-phosphate aldolase